MTSHMTVSLLLLSNSPLQFAVQQLVNIPQGSMVELSIHHPVLAESDFSDCSSLSPLPSPPHNFCGPSDDPQFFRSGKTRRRSSSLSGLEDLEHSGRAEEDGARGRHSSQERRGGDGGERGEGDWKVKKKSGEGDEREGEGGKDKLKKLSESDDDEPPPPYSKTDPQEKKSKRGSGENLPLTDPPRPPSSGANVKTETGISDRRESISPLQLSRISSPPRGLSLSELTRVTPEDQERWRQSRENLEREKSLESLTEIHVPHSPIPDSAHVKEWPGNNLSGELAEDGQTTPLESSSSQRSGGYDPPQMESYSDTTLVGSQSQSDTGVSSLHTGPVNKRETEKTATRSHLRLEPVGNKKKTRRSPKGSHSPKHLQPLSHKSKEKSKSANLAVGYTHVSICIQWNSTP